MLTGLMCILFKIDSRDIKNCLYSLCESYVSDPGNVLTVCEREKPKLL